MFNVTIINLKDIFKIIIIIIIIYLCGKIIFKYSNLQINSNKKIELDQTNFAESSFFSASNIIKKMIKPKEEKKQEKIEKKILDISLKNIPHIEETNNNSINENLEDTAKKEDITPIVQIAETTEVVTKNPIKESYNKEIRGVKIKNETDFELNENNLNPDNLQINKNNIIIFHTHTCEAYTQSEKYKYEDTRKF